MENFACLKISDKMLWQAFKNGKEDAFAKIYQKNIRALISYGYQLTTDINLVEDCIHDLFLELWKRRDYLSDITSINFYLLRALNRKLRRTIVRQRKINYNFSQITNRNEMPLEFNWVNEQIAAENSQKLQKAIKKLSNRQREVLIMHYYEGCDYNEIAKIININYQSVANLMHRTLQKLRKGMKHTEYKNYIGPCRQ